MDEASRVLPPPRRILLGHTPCAPEEWEEETCDGSDGEADNQDVAPSRIVGDGTYGTVYRGCTRAGRTVALKRLRTGVEPQGLPVTALREVKTLQRVDCPYVIELLDVVANGTSTGDRSRTHVTLVFPFMEHDLTGLLENPRVELTTAQLKYYLKCLLEAVHYLHDRARVLHRDIKGPNLLLNNRGEVKLADFGLARPLVDRAEYTPGVVTLWFRSPELLMGARRYGPAVDMWSVGCVFAEMLERVPPFPGQSELDQLHLIYELCGTPDQRTFDALAAIPGVAPVQPKECRPSRMDQRFGKHGVHGLDLLRRLLALDPAQRISARDALDHAYFWEEPLPCDPALLPSFPESHERAVRLRKQRLHRERQQQHQQQQQNQQVQVQHGKQLPKVRRFERRTGRRHHNYHNHHHSNHHHHRPRPDLNQPWQRGQEITNDVDADDSAANASGSSSISSMPHSYNNQHNHHHQQHRASTSSTRTSKDTNDTTHLNQRHNHTTLDQKQAQHSQDGLNLLPRGRKRALEHNHGGSSTVRGRRDQPSDEELVREHARRQAAMAARGHLAVRSTVLQATNEAAAEAARATRLQPTAPPRSASPSLESADFKS